MRAALFRAFESYALKTVPAANSAASYSGLTANRKASSTEGFALQDYRRCSRSNLAPLVCMRPALNCWCTDPALHTAARLTAAFFHRGCSSADSLIRCSEMFQEMKLSRPLPHWRAGFTVAV